MKMSDGLFLRCVRTVGEQYPDITDDDRIVDNACMQLVINPTQFDMLLLPNLYGDIVSDLCAGLVGGLGVVPGANLGEEIGVFEAVHGSAPDIAGKGIANPTALLFSALLMLRHIGEGAMADRIMKAVVATLADGVVRTRDLGGTATTHGIRGRHLSSRDSDGRRDHARRALERRDRQVSSRAATEKAAARRASGSKATSTSCGPRSATRSIAR